VRNVEILFSARCLVKKLTYHCTVVGVNALQHPFDRQLDTRVVFENPKGFVRPVEFVGGGRRTETACATQALELFVPFLIAAGSSLEPSLPPARTKTQTSYYLVYLKSERR
jgi:hypothetical protein